MVRIVMNRSCTEAVIHYADGRKFTISDSDGRVAVRIMEMFALPEEMPWTQLEFNLDDPKISAMHLDEPTAIFKVG